jgi:hypothetical protein
MVFMVFQLVSLGNDKSGPLRGKSPPRRKSGGEIDSSRELKKGRGFSPLRVMLKGENRKYAEL